MNRPASRRRIALRRRIPLRRRVATVWGVGAAWLDRRIDQLVGSNVCMYLLAGVMCAARAWHFVSLRELDDPVAILLDLAGVGGLVVGCGRMARERRANHRCTDHEETRADTATRGVGRRS
jgi:hypothetical protein